MRFSSRLAAVLVLMLVLVPSAGARWYAPHAARALQVSLLGNGSFEGSLAGWGGYNATLTLAADGIVGPGAARVTAKGSGSYSIYPSPMPVQSSVAGTVYTASAWIRSATPGRTLCLRLREWAAGSLVASSQSCQVATTGWAQLPPVAYTARGSGQQLDAYVYATTGTKGEIFEVDGIALDLGSATPAPPPPAPAPLAPPTGLSAGSVGQTDLVLAWTPSTDLRVVSYQVANGGTVVGTTPLSQLAVSALACGTNYSFSVRALDSGGAASSAATVAASTSSCAPQPPAPAPGQLYAADSPLNTLIPAAPQVDALSGAMVQQIQADTGPVGGWPVAAGAWTQPIYYADASTPRYDVALTHVPYNGKVLSGVPIPANAQPDPSSDSTLVVIDKSAGCEYDFQAIHRNADGSWTAHFGNTLYTSGSGIYPYSESPRAGSFGNAAGVITPEELAAGHIDHALTFVMKNTKAGGPVWPSTGSDGWSSLAGAVPEGARVQLDPSLDLDSLGLAPWQKTVARALQQYGMYLIDTGGGLGLQAQQKASISMPYPWGSSDYAYMPTTLISRVRVLQTGPQLPITYRFVPTTCATLR